MRERGLHVQLKESPFSRALHTVRTGSKETKMSTTSQQSRSPQGGFNSVTESFDSLRVWYAALCCRYELLPMRSGRG